MKVSINIVAYNGLKYADDCLKSIYNQTFRDFKVLVVDNASVDGAADYIRKNYPEVTVLQNFKNLGFAKAHNQAIKFWDSDYVLIANQDVILTPTYLEKLVSFADKHPEAGSFGGKTLKLTNNEEKKLGPEIIDSVGLAATKACRFYDKGAGEEDKGQFDQTEEVFGLSGNLVLYRRSALEAVKLNNYKSREGFKFTTDFNYFEYFDEDFFLYKEDIDLAWRLRLNGWAAQYLPSAESYHYRSASAKATLTDWAIAKNRRSKARFINQLSYRNHLLTLVKNQDLKNLILHFPWIFFYELKKFCYVLILETKTLKSLGQFFKLLPNILQKRKQIKKITKVSSKEIKKWFN